VTHHCRHLRAAVGQGSAHRAQHALQLQFVAQEEPAVRRRRRSRHLLLLLRLLLLWSAAGCSCQFVARHSSLAAYQLRRLAGSCSWPYLCRQHEPPQQQQAVTKASWISINGICQHCHRYLLHLCTAGMQACLSQLHGTAAEWLCHDSQPAQRAQRSCLQIGATDMQIQCLAILGSTSTLKKQVH
jgi:hypothetical protein